ncbi:hypothetical protein ABAC460_19830 [Asticcacaulis sp. AC460]|nr:hypothetical protein ABAC460_19830 [Asticcacaulis sp. AC460]
MHFGIAAAQAGQLDAAESSLQRALDLAPGHVEARYNLALILERQGRLADAAEVLTALVAAAPDHVAARIRLGTLHRKNGRLPESLDMIEGALQLAPGHADGHFARAMTLVALERKDEAEAAYRQAIRLQPNLQMAINNLGILLEGRGQPREAMAVYEAAVARDPTQSAPRLNLARLLADSRETRRAIDHYRFLLARDPDNLAVLDSLVFHLRELADWSEIDTLMDRLVKGIEARAAAGEEVAVPPFSALSLPLTSQVQQAVARSHVRKLAGNIAPLAPRPLSASGPLRIGYLSADFREHPVAHLVAGLMSAHDRHQVSVTAYALGPADDSQWRQRVIAGCDRFVALKSGQPHASAQRIRDDGIDILVDLTGYTRFGEPEILAHRPAPVQVNWLGFPGTFGAPWVDFVLADPVVVPPQDDVWFDETVIRLPGCYLIHDRNQPLAEWTPTRAELGLPEHGFVFSCFNNAYKITPEVFADWMAILAAAPDSVLWLLKGPDESLTHFRMYAQEHGIDPDRLIFASHEPKPRHLARYRQADLILDTPIYNAHITASDGIWGGVPVLTRPGDTFAGRVAASLARSVGLDDMIVSSRADYVARAVALAKDPDAYGEVRRRISQARFNSPLFDVQTFARHLEAAFRDMRAARGG